MNLDSLVDAWPGQSTFVVAALGAVAGVLVVVAIVTQLAARRTQRELDRALVELTDPATGLLPRSALRIRLGAEIAWAATSGVPLAVVVLRIRGSGFARAARVLRAAMREEEVAFRFGEDRIVVELWGSTPLDAEDAVRRIGEVLHDAGFSVVDAGVACSPRDGSDVETLVAAARRSPRPVDEPGLVADDDAVRAAPRGVAARLVAAAMHWAAMAIVLVSAWRLLPAAIEPALAGDGSRTSRELIYALVAAIGLPIGAALVVAAGWSSTRAGLPRSRPLGQLGVPAAALIVALVGAPLAWGIFAPLQPAQLVDAFGAVLAMAALLILLVHAARHLIRLPALVLVLLVAAGCATTWLSVEEMSLPLLADLARLVAATALGALLASLVERASWIAGLAVLAAGIDVWSVIADAGISRQLLEGGAGSGGDRIVELLIVQGPIVGGSPLLSVGAVDVVFLALLLTWSHDWRLDVRWVTLMLLVATWCTITVGELLAEPVPLLPSLAAAMLLVLAVRWARLRRRVAG